MAAVKQDPFKLGAKGNLHILLLSWKRSVHGAERNSRNFHLKCEEAQKQHPSLSSLPPPRGDSSLQGKENTETTSWSLRHGQRKLVEIFQLGNRSSQAIKCFTQTRSLTTLGPLCSISHTARLATCKIKASDHKHKKELCPATVHFEHSNSPEPQGETGFVPISFRKRLQPAKIPHYSHGRSGHYTAGGAQGTCHRGRSSGELFVHHLQSLAQDVWHTLLSSCGYFQFLKGLGVGEPHPCLLWTL